MVDLALQQDCQDQDSKNRKSTFYVPVKLNIFYDGDYDD
jgi:hypothetical protein